MGNSLDKPDELFTLRSHFTPPSFSSSSSSTSTLLTSLPTSKQRQLIHDDLSRLLFWLNAQRSLLEQQFARVHHWTIGQKETSEPATLGKLQRGLEELLLWDRDVLQQRCLMSSNNQKRGGKGAIKGFSRHNLNANSYAPIDPPSTSTSTTDLASPTAAWTEKARSYRSFAHSTTTSAAHESCLERLVLTTQYLELCQLCDSATRAVLALMRSLNWLGSTAATATISSSSSVSQKTTNGSVDYLKLLSSWRDNVEFVDRTRQAFIMSYRCWRLHVVRHHWAEFGRLSILPNYKYPRQLCIDETPTVVDAQNGGSSLSAKEWLGRLQAIDDAIIETCVYGARYLVLEDDFQVDTESLVHSCYSLSPRVLALIHWPHRKLLTAGHIRAAVFQSTNRLDTLKKALVKLVNTRPSPTHMTLHLQQQIGKEINVERTAIAQLYLSARSRVIADLCSRLSCGQHMRSYLHSSSLEKLQRAADRLNRACRMLFGTVGNGVPHIYFAVQQTRTQDVREKPEQEDSELHIHYNNDDDANDVDGNGMNHDMDDTVDLPPALPPLPALSLDLILDDDIASNTVSTVSSPSSSRCVSLSSRHVALH